MPEVIREYCKKTGQKEPGNIGEVARCVYESLAFKFRYLFEIFWKNLPVRNLTCCILSEEEHRIDYFASGYLMQQEQVIAGPTETTSVGNLLMQLKADGEIKNIEEGRKISLASSEVIEYEPHDTEIWDEAYQNILKY